MRIQATSHDTAKEETVEAQAVQTPREGKWRGKKSHALEEVGIKNVEKDT